MADAKTLRRKFLSKLDELTIKPTERSIHGEVTLSGPPFLLTEQLKDWLKSPASPSSKHFVAQRLIHEAYADDYDTLPLEEDKALNKYLLVFCILLELDHGRLLHKFMRHRFEDSAFPEDDPESLKRMFSKLDAFNEHEVGEFAQKFEQTQWKYFPAQFEQDMDDEWNSKQIVPICDRQLISDKGLTAHMYQVAVPEEFVHDTLRSHAAPFRFEHPDFASVGKCYHFALKVFENAKQLHFTEERRAYRMVKSHKGMVKCLGSFSHRDYMEDRKTTHNILLEFGDYDLNEYFYRAPPVLPQRLQKFWDDFLHIPAAIRDLHDFEKTVLDEQHRYQGCHADIKSDNILVVQGEFKLADPGFARFRKRQVDQLVQDQAWSMPFGGTITYGAPECSISDPEFFDPPKIDMWSLGCVLSEVATWVVLGRAGVLRYSMLRREAISRMVADFSVSQRQSRRGSTTTLVEGDYFHDGREVLKEVSQWHEFLRSVVRPTDPLTSPILTIVDKHLLKGNPEKRLKSKDLYERLLITLRSVQLKTLPATAGLIETILETANIIEEIESRNLAIAASTDRRANKSSKVFLQVPAQGGLFVSPSKTYTTPTKARSTVPQLIPTASGTRRASTHALKTPQRVSTGTISTQSTSGQGTNSTVTSFETIFDAHYSCYVKGSKEADGKDHAAKRFLKNVLKTRSQDKDKLLAEFFINRDLLFLVDNAESMFEHWSKVFLVLEILTRKAQNLDKDGMELRFTNTTKSEAPPRGRELEKFRDAMALQEVRPSRPGWMTDMSAALGDILTEWLERPGESKKNMTIIVLTDGIWHGMDHEEAVDQKIIEFETFKQKTIPNVRKRPVSIQFVSFGNNPFALDRLNRLDNELKTKGIPDIVDTEPSDGNVYKMLLGSFIDIWDSMNDVTEADDTFGMALSPTHISNGSDGSDMLREHNYFGRVTSPQQYHS